MADVLGRATGIGDGVGVGDNIGAGVGNNIVVDVFEIRITFDVVAGVVAFTIFNAQSSHRQAQRASSNTYGSVQLVDTLSHAH